MLAHQRGIQRMNQHCKTWLFLWFHWHEIPLATLLPRLISFVLILIFQKFFSIKKNEFLSHKIYVRYLKIRKIMDNCVIKKKKVARSLFSPPMRLPCCLHRQCYNERNARHALAYKAPNRGTDAFGCTVPCNGVFSRCLAIRFYRLEKKACVNACRRVCFALIGMHSTLGIAAYVPSYVYAAGTVSC